MRFDMFRRRPAHPPPSPLPSSPYRQSSSSPFQSPSSRWLSSDRHHRPSNNPETSTNSSHHRTSPQSTPSSTRSEYIRALESRMDQMERVPTSSFYHSYAGEFDMLACEDKEAVRRLNEFETSTRVENAHRNRYPNILSNEPTRVRLQAISPGENDYINANRVSGYDQHPGYIATQAPLPDTTPHFWQMVYESVTPAIIMLTREYEDDCHSAKCERYWPAVGQNILFNDYLVKGIDEHMYDSMGLIERRFHVVRVVDKRHQSSADSPSTTNTSTSTTSPGEHSMWQTPSRSRSSSMHSNRNFANSCNNTTNHNVNPYRNVSNNSLSFQQRIGCEYDEFDNDTQDLLKHLELGGPVLEVVQLQYVDWPDQDVPASPCTLLELCRRVNALSYAQWRKTNVRGAPIVHCSAGVGRTGTFIAIDRTLRRLSDAFSGAQGECRQGVYVEEIRELVRTMKRERSKMVQTAEQYRFIYLAVLEAMKNWEQGQAMFTNQTQTVDGIGHENEDEDVDEVSEDEKARETETQPNGHSSNERLQTEGTG